MKKTVLALALMGAFSGAAFAQSNVTMYGIVDVNYTWQDQPTQVGSTVQLKSVNMINSGGQSGSRWGVRGTEALGGGLSAIFDLEAGFDVSTGQSQQGSNASNTTTTTAVNRLFGRQAYAGLSSNNWGAVVLGRLATFSSGTGDFDMIGRVDPFLTGFGIASAGSTFISMNALRVDNAIAYQSPTWAGFKFGVGYSTNISGGELSNVDANVKATIFGANWTYGPFFVAATYDVVNNTLGRPDQKHIQVGGTWDIASFRLHAAWADQSNIGVISAPGLGTGTFIPLPTGIQNFDNNAWLLGVTWTASEAIKVFGSWQSSNADGQQRAGINFDPDYNVWGIGATYNLSRRTNLYSMYAQRNANGTLLDNSFNTKQFMLGVRHLF